MNGNIFLCKIFLFVFLLKHTHLFEISISTMYSLRYTVSLVDRGCWIEGVVIATKLQVDTSPLPAGVQTCLVV